MVLIFDAAPTFDVPALLPGKIIGNVKLNDYLESKWVLIFFYPSNFSKASPDELIKFAARREDFEKFNCHLLAISCDSVYNHLAWSNTDRSKGGLGELSIPLLADFDRSIASNYGILLETGVMLRAVTLISPDGIVKEMLVNDYPIEKNCDDLLEKLDFYINDTATPLFASTTSATSRKPASSLFHQDISPVNASSSNPISSAVISTNTLISQVLSSMTSTALNWISSAIYNYNHQLRTSPLLTKAITSGVISIIAEGIGSYMLYTRNQRTGRGDQQRSVQQILYRLAVFGVYGLAITGPFFHWWYGYLERVVARWQLPSTIAFLVKLSLNQLVMTPPFLLFIMAFLQYCMTWNRIQTIDVIKKTFGAALMTNWKIWTVAQAVNFQLVPTEYRVMFGNVIALWWNIYLSLVSAPPVPTPSK